MTTFNGKYDNLLTSIRLRLQFFFDDIGYLNPLKFSDTSDEVACLFMIRTNVDTYQIKKYERIVSQRQECDFQNPKHLLSENHRSRSACLMIRHS